MTSPAVAGLPPLGITGIANFRDVGGCPTREGGRVRRGLLYRSTELSRIAGDDLTAFDRLGIRRVYDLRTDAERRLLPDALPPGIAGVVVDVLADASGPGPTQLMTLLDDPAAATAALGAGGSTGFFETKYRELVALPSARAGFGRLFRDLADERGRPAVVHCTTGKDRTGWAAAALQLLLGVPEPIVMAAYLRSNELLAATAATMLAEVAARGGDPEVFRALTEAREPYLRAALDEVDRRHGTIERYFAEGLGLDTAVLDALRHAFVEPLPGGAEAIR